MAIIAECEWCNSEYDAKRSTSRFCGPKCKQAFYRNRMNPGVTLRDDKSVTVTKADSHVDASDIGVVKALHQAISKPKRGKDIKGFIDLPMDVQQTITRLCPDVVKDHAERCRRSGIAIRYQHLFPNKYNSTGVA